MCGIAGFYSVKPFADNFSSTYLELMLNKLKQRGPDSSGKWFSKSGNVALGHTRLAIRDLTPAGAQPMKSPCSRYSLTFNGEIYNHLDIRSKIISSFPSSHFIGSSDTETLLLSISLFGLEQTLSFISGMFAFAVYDNLEEKLYVCRDRLGEKPLYYGFTTDPSFRKTFVFSSAIQSLVQFPALSCDISTDAISFLPNIIIFGTLFHL